MSDEEYEIRELAHYYRQRTKERHEDFVKSLKAENAALREALRFYAGQSFSDTVSGEPTWVNGWDDGKKASAALKEGE
jgi:cell shape-determining protein MreC